MESNVLWLRKTRSTPCGRCKYERNGEAEMANEKTPAQRVAEMTPEERARVKKHYWIAAAIEFVILAVTLILLYVFYQKSEDCFALMEAQRGNVNFDLLAMLDQVDALKQKMIMTSVIGGASVLATFVIFMLLNPNNRESIYREIRKLEKAEKAKN